MAKYLPGHNILTTEKVYKYSVFRLGEKSPKSIPTMSKPENTITFIAPSYLLYAVPSGKSDAVAVFENDSTHPPSHDPVDLGQNTFVEVGSEGKPGGYGPLIQINISDGFILPLFPESSLTVGPGAYAIFQRLVLEESLPEVYQLSVFFEGKLKTVDFKGFPVES